MNLQLCQERAERGALIGVWRRRALGGERLDNTQA